MNSQLPSRRFLLGILSVFAILSVADLLLTWLLLSRQQSDVIESNPLAAWILESFGWTGMTIFKFAMVTFIGVIAYGLTHRRPRAGEMVLVFGCGAQAAVVTMSVFMWWGDATFDVPNITVTECESCEPSTLPTDALTLLVKKSVQAELNLTQKQISAVAEMTKLRRSLSQATRRAHTDELSIRLDQSQTTERGFMASLSRQQSTRLHEIVWQYRGPLAFGDAEVMGALKLTGEQCDIVAATLERVNSMENSRRSRRMITVVTHEGDDPIAQAKSDLLAMLTPDQRARWHDLQGKPFPFEPLATGRAVADAD